MTIKKALKWISFWVGLAVLFNIGIYLYFLYLAPVKGVMIAHQKALEFFGGYIIELSLSVDNLFLFLLIFTSFSIPLKYQRRVLNYGIMGAIILRLIFIVLGVTIVNKFHWVLYVFGFLLMFSGLKLLYKEEKEPDFSKNPLFKLLGKIIPVSATLEDEKFFVQKNRILYATPLLAILVLVEGSDIIFAIDSIPAIFSITRDPLIVYTSNIFAILGLRSLYFILEKLHNSFRFVKYGVAVILIFTGIKLAVLMFHFEIPLLLSILIIFGILALSVVLSVIIKNKEPELGEV